MINQQDEHAFSTGEIHEAPEPQDHPAGCLCTGCTTERLLAREGRYDRHFQVARHLQQARELRKEFESHQVPGSAGAGEYKRAEVAGVAEARTVTPPPTVEDAA